VSAPALLEFRQAVLDPTENPGVRERNAPIRHHDDQVPQAQLETRVPADTDDDDLPVEMPSLEQYFAWYERSILSSSPDHGLFAPEPGYIAASRAASAAPIEDRDVGPLVSPDSGPSCRRTVTGEGPRIKAA
jgi:hypothetical protein